MQYQLTPNDAKRILSQIPDMIEILEQKEKIFDAYADQSLITEQSLFDKNCKEIIERSKLKRENIQEKDDKLKIGEIVCWENKSGDIRYGKVVDINSENFKFIYNGEIHLQKRSSIGKDIFVIRREMISLLLEVIKVQTEELATILAEIEERENRKEKAEPVKIENESETFCGYQSVSCTIDVQFEDGTYSEYVIVNDEEEEDFKNNVFHYKSKEGLELLSAAFAKQRNKEGTIRGKKYEVKKVDNNKENDKEYKCLTSLLIKPNGGYYYKLKNEHFEKVIDVLLYSLAENRYEIIHATYDKKQDICYTDIGLFKRYINKYGKPDLDYSDSFNKKKVYDQDELNDESILMGFGYNVSAKDDYSSKQRQEILAEVVDLELLTVKRVVNFLVFLINMHPDDKYKNARSKWKEDIKFIQDYKVNPDRFLIAK